MRGPGVRLDLDVRRVWKCPACQRLRRLPGDLTAVRCQCAGEPWMQIAEERIPRFQEQKSTEARELTVESFQLTEEELSRPLPGRVRRRGPGPRGADGPGGEGAANSLPAANDRPNSGVPNDRGSREPQPPGQSESQTGGAAQRRPRPPRPPRGSKKPLAEIANLPDEQSRLPSSPPTDQAQPIADEFSAGIDLPAPDPNVPETP